jgi:hypothetical protein
VPFKDPVFVPSEDPFFFFLLSAYNDGRPVPAPDGSLPLRPGRGVQPAPADHGGTTGEQRNPPTRLHHSHQGILYWVGWVR